MLQCLEKEIATAKELDLRLLGKVIIFRVKQTAPIIYRFLTQDMNSPHPSRQRSQQSNVDSRHYPQAFV